MNKSLPLAAIILGLSAGLAEAHVGHGSTTGFVHGFIHPVSGIDHILVMVAVGMFAVILGGRALWLLPSSFVGMMVVGGMLGNLGVHIPFVEFLITLSVIILGAAVTLQWRAPVMLAVALVGFFAVFHGHAHGAEMPSDVSPFGYGLGFVLATLALHVAGLSLGLAAKTNSKLLNSKALRLGGGAMTIAGVGLLGGWI